VKVENKCGKHRSAHECIDKEVSAPYSACEGVTVETVDKSVKFRLKMSKEKQKKDESDKSDSSESESVTIKHNFKRTQKKWLYPEKCYGITPLSLFWTNVESCAVYNDWTDNDKLAHVRLRLAGTAAHVFSGGINAVPTYSDLVKKLKKRFGTKYPSARYRSQLQKGRRRQKNETLYNVYDDISRLVLIAYPEEQSVHWDDFGVEAFIEALDDYQLELYVRSQNPKDLEAALKYASIMESFISTRGNRTEAEQFNTSEKPEKQPVDKYGGRVRSVTENGEIQTTEAFVGQVVERIQGIIEAKLTPTIYSPTPILSAAYPGLNYQANPFCPTPYANVAIPQVGYNVASIPQVGYNAASIPQPSVASVPQPSVTTTQIVSEISTNNTPSTVKVYETKKRCWICILEHHFVSNCPNRIAKVTTTTPGSNTNNKPDLKDPNEPCRYCKKTGHTVKDCYKLANKKLAEAAEKLRTDSLQPPNAIARVIFSEGIPKPTRDKFVYIAATINGTPTKCLCDSGCDVNFLAVHYFNINDVLPSNCKLSAAVGTPIEVLGHCKIPIQLENSLSIETDFIISPSIKEPMLRIE